MNRSTLFVIFASVIALRTAKCQNQAGLKPGYLVKERDLELTKYVQGLNFRNVGLDKVDGVFSNRAWVKRLTDCILHVGYCDLPFGYDIHKRIHSARDGGELCPGCTRAETINQLQAIIRTISLYRQHHPEQWKRVEDELRFLSSRL